MPTNYFWHATPNIYVDKTTGFLNYDMLHSTALNQNDWWDTCLQACHDVVQNELGSNQLQQLLANDGINVSASVSTHAHILNHSATFTLKASANVFTPDDAVADNQLKIKLRDETVLGTVTIL